MDSRPRQGDTKLYFSGRDKDEGAETGSIKKSNQGRGSCTEVEKENSNRVHKGDKKREERRRGE